MLHALLSQLALCKQLFMPSMSEKPTCVLHQLASYLLSRVRRRIGSLSTACDGVQCVSTLTAYAVGDLIHCSPTQSLNELPAAAV